MIKFDFVPAELLFTEMSVWKLRESFLETAFPAEISCYVIFWWEKTEYPAERRKIKYEYFKPNLQEC